VTPSSPAGRPGAVPGQRRSPLQQRSLLRLDRILEAAASLLDEEPYEDITTGLIAERAGVAIGSVYRFFEDKAAVYRALMARHFELYLTRLEAAFADRPAGSSPSWTQMAETAIDCFVAMERGTPGFRGFGDAIDVNLLDTDRDNDTVLADRLLELVTTELGISPSDAVRLALLVAVTTADALLSLAFRRDPNGDETVIAEAKTVVRTYLAPYIEPESSTSRTGRRR
jgi:AcrR family transcriptional regulator